MNTNELGKILKQRRLMAGLTLRELAAMSGVSLSHLGRLERGERFPSASILRKIAQPLRFGEGELFAIAGYLSPQPPSTDESSSGRRLDPYVAIVLSHESPEIQRMVLAILSILKCITKGIDQEKF